MLSTLHTELNESSHHSGEIVLGILSAPFIEEGLEAQRVMCLSVVMKLGQDSDRI